MFILRIENFLVLQCAASVRESLQALPPPFFGRGREKGVWRTTRLCGRWGEVGCTACGGCGCGDVHRFWGEAGGGGDGTVGGLSEGA